MIIDRIKYGKSYQIGLSMWERVDMEASIEAHESANSCMGNLKKEVDFAHRAMNPQLYPTGKEPLVSNFELPQVQVEKEIETTESAIIKDIKTVTDMKVLDSYRFIAKKYPSIQGAINQKEKQLTT